MKYYRVVCERGHCGNKRSTPITFYFQAPNALEAITMGRRMPGVKHSRFPLECQEIAEDDYKLHITSSAYVRAGRRA